MRANGAGHRLAQPSTRGVRFADLHVRDVRADGRFSSNAREVDDSTIFASMANG